jgi:UPF0176 protein
VAIEAKSEADCKCVHQLDFHLRFSEMSGQMISIASFYSFTPLADPAATRERILRSLQACGVKGSVLLAPEGVNGTIAGTDANVEAARAAIAEHCGLSRLDTRRSSSACPPFLRLKVRLKKHIVTIGGVAADPNAAVGEYVEPEDWNTLIADPAVILVDTRNAYEHRIGAFRGAIDPGTASFSEFPAWVRRNLGHARGRKIATYCTGGIRCEKATSFMRLEGFESVFHLKGGILGYLEKISPADSLWSGGCFVFDERVAVGHGLLPLDFTVCHGCLMPVSRAERESPLFEEGVSCPACANTLTAAQKSSNRERQRQFAIAEARGKRHLGPREG